MTLLYPQFLIMLLFFVWFIRQRSVDIQNTWKLHAALFLAIIALAQPVMNVREKEERLKGEDYIIALDVSYSMRATDIAPSRLAASKVLIKEMLNLHPTDRFSLFAFTTNGLILSPPTTDHQLISTAMDALEIDNILTKGTNLENLLVKVAKMPMPVKHLLLFSDGEDSFDPRYLSDLAKKENIIIHAYAMATSGGSTLEDAYGKKLKDKEGNLVISRLNPSLKSLAIESGGSFESYENIDLNFEYAKETYSANTKQQGYITLYWLPLLIAVILFSMQFISVPAKWLVWIPFITVQSQAGLLDWYYIAKAEQAYKDAHYLQAIEAYDRIEHKTMQSEMNLANGHYQIGNFKKAYTIYKSLHTTNPALKQKILFKLGNCALYLQQFDEARRYYKAALSFGKNEDIVYNLTKIMPFQDRSRKDFAAFFSEDKAKQETPQGSQKQKTKPQKEGTRQMQTGLGESAQGVSSKQKSDTKRQAPSKQTRPMGYKAYEMINEGYMHEEKPW